MTRPIRVLHEVWDLGIGGVQTFLMGSARRLRNRGVRMDFVVNTETPGHFEKEALSLGGKIFRTPEFGFSPARLARRFGALRGALSAGGPYDVFACHYDISGPSLALAARAGVPVRIVHAHSSAPELRFRHPLTRRLLKPLTRGLIGRYATDGIAVSIPAAASRFGAEWSRDPRWAIRRCGVDLASLRPGGDRESFRREWGLPVGAVVLLHIGRLSHEKNQGVLLAMSAELSRRGISHRVVCLGEGPRRKRLADAAIRLGIAENLMMPGNRLDVSAWLRHGADVLVFPSLFEGLPLAVIESQAAGVPVLMSERVTGEAAVIPELVTRLPLAAPAPAWVDHALELIGRKGTIRPDDAWRRIEASPFNIDTAAAALEMFYRDALERRRG